MRKLLLLALLYTGFAQAQIEQVSIGYGKMNFPSIEINGISEADPSKGGTAYLSIGTEKYGGMLFIGGDSRISYGGEDYGSGMVGLAGFREFKINEWLDAGPFIGVVGFQTYKKADLTNGQFRDPNPFPQPELKKTNIQPYGGVRLVVQGWIEIQYAPVSKMLTFGVKLYNGN